jgi:hypothetical protein
LYYQFVEGKKGNIMTKKIKKNILLLGPIVIFSIVFLMFIFLLSFKGIQKPNKSILIATEKSDYKNKLVDMLSEEFKKKGFYIKVIDVTYSSISIDSVIIYDWKTIIIINSIKAGRLNWYVENFIMNNNLDSKIILINTSDSGNAKTNHNIDAITTASNMNQTDTIKDLILDKVD